MDSGDIIVPVKKNRRKSLTTIRRTGLIFLKKFKTTLTIFIALLIVSFFEISFIEAGADEKITKVLRLHVASGIKELAAGLEEMKKAISGKDKLDSADVLILKVKFLKCRIAFKKIEAFTSHFFPASDRNMNGPVVSEIEDEGEENPQIEKPHGF